MSILLSPFEIFRLAGGFFDNLAPQEVAALPAIGEGGTPIEPEEPAEPSEASPAREDMDIGELEYE